MAEEPQNNQAALAAVGALILEFGQLENAVSAGLRLHLLFRLRKHKVASGLYLAGAIYGSLRLKASKNIMRRIMVEEGAEPSLLSKFDEAFDHIGHINTLRDKLAHHSVGWDTDTDTWTVSDLVNTRATANTLKYEFKTADILSAARDLNAAHSLVKYFLPHGGMKRIDQPIELPTWRYKPSSLKLVRQKTPKTAPARKRPPRSSKGKP